MSNRNWGPIIDMIKGSRRVLIFTHTNMDGDAAGSAAALCLVLRKMGREAWVLLEDKMPDYLSFLDLGVFCSQVPYDQDLSIAVDLGSWDRLEKRVDIFRKAPAMLVIDHHMPSGGFCEPCLVEPTASSAGLLVFDLIKTMDPGLMDRDIANALYTAILTDTGGFKYDSTGAESFHAAAELVELGAEYSKIATEVFDNKPLAQLKVDALALERAEFLAEGRIAMSYITLADLEALEALPEYCENAINVMRSIEGVEVAALLKERKPGSFKLSLRAKEYADVRSIAVQFAGGGHLRAAGGQIDLPLEGACEALRGVLDAFSASLRENI
jgi:phosphoesterase RecJ-like protein